MGGAVEAEIASCEDLALAGTSEYVPEADSIGAADVIIDFSHPNNTRAVCERAARDGTALVLGTTGLGDAHRQCIVQAAQKAPSCIRRIFPRASRFLSACWPKCAA